MIVFKPSDPRNPAIRYRIVNMEVVARHVRLDDTKLKTAIVGTRAASRIGRELGRGRRDRSTQVFIDHILPLDPSCNGLPFGIVWRRKLRSSAMPLVAACFVPQRMNEQRARERVAGKYLFPDCLEILTGLLFSPRCASGRKDFQPHRSRRIAFAGTERMAGITAGVARASGQKNGFDVCPVKLEAQSRRWGRRLRTLLRVRRGYEPEQAEPYKQQQSSHGCHVVLTLPGILNLIGCSDPNNFID